MDYYLETEWFAIKFWLALIGIMTIASIALAHGDAMWIENNIGAPEGERYLDDQLVHCCGPKDCEVAPEGAIIEKDGKMHIPSTGQYFTYKQRGSYISIDEHWWWCRRDGVVKCVFRPSGGV